MCKIYNFRKYNLADPIKDIANIIFNWDENKLNGKLKDMPDEKTGIVPREFFKWIGTDIFQYAIHEKFPQLNIPERNIWVNCMKEFIEDHSNLHHIVISDIRFKHEADALIESGGYLIYIDRNSEYSDSYEISELLNDSNKKTGQSWIFRMIDNNETYDHFFKQLDNLVEDIKEINIKKTLEMDS